MKQILKNKKICIAIILIILIIGIVMIVTKGLNFDLKYETSKRIYLNLNQEFKKEDIKNITNEVLGENKVIIQKVEVYEDMVSITSNDITEEQKNMIVEKVNEKYELEIDSNAVEIVSIPHTRARDIIKPYIIPFIIATIIILVYLGIRYHKLGGIKVILQSGVFAVIAQALLLSVMAICRIPIGRLTIPLILIVYSISIIIVTTKFENKLKEIKQEEKK